MTEVAKKQSKNRKYLLAESTPRKLDFPAINRRNFIYMAGASIAAGLIPKPYSWIGAAAAQAQQGGTLRITMTGDPEVLDPNYLLTDYELRICEMLYNGLVGVDENLNLVPDLAEEWAISSDARTYEYKLRRGVLFHHGRELNADDVAFTLTRMKDSWTGYLVSDLDRIEVTGTHSFRLEFKAPAAYFLASMAPRWTAIVPKDLIEKNGKDAFSRAPVGTGAYKFVERISLQKVVLERNEEYFEEGIPYVDRIEWIPVQDENARSLQIIGGAANLDFWAPLKLLDSLKSAPDVKILGGPTTRYEYAELNKAREPFNKFEMRKAVALATDRQAIVDLALLGHGEALVGGPIGPAGNPWFNDFNVYSEPDIDQAKALVAAAGYGDGVTVEGICAGGSRYSDVMEILQQQWSQIGININITTGETGAVKTQRKQGQYDVITEGWGTLVDPNDFVGEQFRTDGGLNWSASGDDKLDELLLNGKAETDFEKRKVIYREVERYLLEESLPMVFLYRPYENAAYRSNVHGLKHEAGRTRISLTETWLST